MRYENLAGFFSAADPAPAGKELEFLMAGTKVSRVTRRIRRTNELRISQVAPIQTKYPNRTIGG